MNPLYPLKYLLFVLAWWTNRVGAKGVLGMLAAGTVLAVIVNYMT